MKVLIIIFLFLSPASLLAQDPLIDSLRKELSLTKADTARVLLMTNLAEIFCFYQIDSAIDYSKNALSLAKKSNYQYGQYAAFVNIYWGYNTVGDYSRALETALNAYRIAEQMPNRRLESMAKAQMIIGFIYRLMGFYVEAIAAQNIAMDLQRASGQPILDLATGIAAMPMSYLGLKRPDSALQVINFLIDQCAVYLKTNKTDSSLWYVRDFLPREAKRAWPLTYAIIGLVYESLGNSNLAEKYYEEGIRLYKVNIEHDNQYFLMRLYINLSRFLQKIKRVDSSIHYASLAYQTSHRNNFFHYELDAAKLIVQLYESQKKPDSVVKYMKLMIAANDSVFSQVRIRKFQSIEYSEEQRKQEAEAANQRYKTQLRFNVLIGALAVFFLIAFILYKNNRQKQKAYRQLDKQREATEIQKTKAENALADLKSTQAQLIQSEKMASLGELTAGIAHEIQNPLNFVNNFSEVNTELFDEMQKEFRDGKSTEAFEIANDIRQNLEKISQHGKRADAIVKGMLMHSRISTGLKEPTDLNALAEEFLRISYYGMRAKDKSFNCEIKTNLDQSVGKVNLVPQDMGRVLMNLYNNAFYSLSEKKKRINGKFNPLVEISTRKYGDHVELGIRDNGMGIPREVIDKIFQPFFTTKPTGQGTGLGLSLTYDIITKEHEGKISVDTVQGEYAEFKINLPAQI